MELCIGTFLRKITTDTRDTNIVIVYNNYVISWEDNSHKTGERGMKKGSIEVAIFQFMCA